jgi:predicted nucleotide-binding protein (sugar kinase/HSP70/actin superfamily)
LNEQGYAVLTCESVSHLGTNIDKVYEIRDMVIIIIYLFYSIFVYCKYTFESRIIDACKYVSLNDDFIFIHLSSFGCAVTPQTVEQCSKFMVDFNKFINLFF